MLRKLVAIAHDAAMCTLAWLGAHALRFNLEIPPAFLQLALDSVLWIVPLHVVVFHSFGLYRGIWRFASLPDLKRIAAAVLLGGIVATTLVFMLRTPIPRSVLILHPILLMLMMCGSRLAYRSWKEHRLHSFIPGEREPVLVLGGADAAERLTRELSRSPKWVVVGILDDNEGHHRRRLYGIMVLGPLEKLKYWAERLSVQRAIIAMPEATHRERRRALDLCRAAGVEALTVPSFEDLIDGRVTVSQIRHVELDDLLGRDPVVLDTAGLRAWLADRVVMVTGAGGSIGAELCRQIARYAPRCLVLYESNEYAMYQIEQEFRDMLPDVEIRCVIGDVRDRSRVRQILRNYRPSIVFHAAAYKHVPLMEGENAWQAVQNNVAGTRILAELAIAHAVEKFVLVSTDKAVNPTNVMGATKRLAELVCQSLQQRGDTLFVMVRFGNVLGSTGSVIPKFREQIARGGPVTVTDSQITRYFMSIPEAVQLVLQAGLMGKGGEVFVLDMGEPVRIVELAREMIRLSGLSEEEIRIVYTGLRPGEKLFEEPLAAHESTLATPHAKLRIVQARQEDDLWLARLAVWLERADAPDDEMVRRELTHWVPEYRSPVLQPATSRVAS